MLAFVWFCYFIWHLNHVKKNHVHNGRFCYFLILRICEYVTLTGKRDFAVAIWVRKDFEIERLSWFMWMDSNSSRAFKIECFADTVRERDDYIRKVREIQGCLF